MGSFCPADDQMASSWSVVKFAFVECIVLSTVDSLMTRDAMFEMLVMACNRN